MVIAVRQVASDDIRLRLELVGLDMMSAIEETRATHILLMPRNPRLAGDWDDADEKWLPGQDEVAWDFIEEVEKEAKGTAQCLWDFVELAGVPDGDFPSAVLKFVRTWGILARGDEEDYPPPKRDITSWRIGPESFAQSTHCCS